MKRRNSVWHKLWSFCVSVLAFVSTGHAQELAYEPYKEEAGVFTKHYYHLNFYFEKGELKATMDVEREKLIIDDQFTGRFYQESIFYGYFHRLNKWEAATLIPTEKGFRTVKTNQHLVKSAKEDFVFYDDSKELEISFSNIKSGNRTNLKYQIQITDLNMLPKFMLQSYMPIEHLVIKVTMPKGLSAIDHYWGEGKINVSKRVLSEKNGTTIIWEGRNIPKVKSYANAPSYAHYVDHLLLRLDAYTNAKTGSTKRYLSNTDDLYRFCYNFVADLKNEPSADLIAKVKQLTAGKSDDYEKAKSIFAYVQRNVRYVAFSDSLGGFVPREADLVFKRQYGDCKDMSNLLMVMCDIAGLSCSRAWIGTRDIPYSIKQLPIPSAFNHMIAAAKIGGKWLFMDATDMVTPFGHVPYALQGKEAFIAIGPGEYEIVTLPYSEPGLSKVVDTTFMVLKNNQIEGKAKMILDGHIAWDLGSTILMQSGKDIEKLMRSITKRGNNKYIQKHYEYTNLENGLGSLAIEADFVLGDYVKAVGQNYFVNMHLNRPYQDIKVDDMERKAPLNFDYSREEQYVVVLEIPKGYKVSHMPKNLSSEFKDVGHVSVEYWVKEQKVYLNSKVVLKQAVVPPRSFEEYNKMVAALQQIYRETIEITKE